MFSAIRKRLTLLYAAITAVFLCLFAAAFYLGLSHVLLREQTQDALRITVRESRPYRDFLTKPDRARETRNRSPFTEEELFFYVISPEGRLAYERETVSGFKNEVLQRVKNRPGEFAESLFVTDAAGQSVRIVLAAQPLVDDGRTLGQAVFGKSLAVHERTMDQLARMLGLSALIFVVLAGIIGYFAAGRALVPIRQAFASQRQFVADASHELRTPLSVFQISLEALYKLEKARLGPESVDIITGLTDEVRRMTRLVGDLLTLARADSGAVEIQREQFDAHMALGSAVRRLSSLAASKKIALRWTAPDEMPVLADRDRLVQLVYVLVDNAIKYTNPGGRVDVSMTPVNRGTQSGFHLEVKDSGIGMTEHECAKIFERFYRVDKVRSRETGGFGLGLAIAAWIVHTHGGHISVSSKPGEGSLFTVFIPGK